MWVAQRAFDLDNATDYVTVVKFARLPNATDDRMHESLICGGNDGAVLRVDVSGLARLQEEENVAHETPLADRGALRVPASCVSTLWRHRGCVLAVELHENLIASSDDAGEVRLALGGQVLCTLAHNPTHRGDAQPDGASDLLAPGTRDTDTVAAGSAVRALVLWDGQPQWVGTEGVGSSTRPDEAEVVYLFTACDDGYVRLWRVNVATSNYEVIDVFAPPASFEAVDDTASASTPAIFSLCLDFDCNRVAQRLFAGTANGWYSWSLERVTPSGSAAASLTVGEWLGRSVWVKDADVIETTMRTAPLKPKVAAVTCSRGFGTVSDWSEKGDTVTLTFPQLKKAVVWPKSIARGTVRADAYGSCHAGPAYSVQCLEPGVILSSGSDGRICCLVYDSATLSYTFKCVVGSHKDLIKTLIVVNAPTTVLSASYDGTVKMWSIQRDLGFAVCANTVSVEQGAVPLTSEPSAKPRPLLVGGGFEETPQSKQQAPLVGVGAVALLKEASLLFTVSLFERIVRTFVLLECATCEPPPGYMYNGLKTIKLYETAEALKLAEEASTTEVDPFRSREADREAIRRHPLFGDGAPLAEE